MLRSLKPIFGLLQAIVPVVYCGGLVYYFIGQGGSIEDMKAIGLWPFVVGLGVVGLLFCVPLLLKIVGIIFVLRSPGSRGPSPDGEAFDADAVVARYKARQFGDTGVSAMPVGRKGSGPEQRPHFGRRNR